MAHDSSENTRDGPYENRFRRLFGRYASELREAAEESTDPEAADAYEVLAALARGESPPSEAAQRVLDQAKGRGK